MPSNVVIGARTQLLYTEETTWGTTPTTPNMREMRFTSLTLNPGRSLIESSEYVSTRSTPAPGQGTPFPGFSIGVEYQAKTLGTLIKHLLTDTTTVVTTTYPGTVDLSSGANVTGLFLVLNDSGTGVTTVTFDGVNPVAAADLATDINTAVGTNVATVNASNQLTLYPSTSGPGGYVKVYSTTSSTVLTEIGWSARTEWNYTRLKASRDLLEGLSFEVGFTDRSLYSIFTGSKLNSISTEISPNALVTGSFEFLARSGGEDWTGATSAASIIQDFSPKFDSFNGELLVDGVAEARLRSISWSVSNNMEEDFQTVYTAFRDSLPEGQRSVNGSIQVKLDNTDWVDRARNFTQTAISVKMENTSVNDNRFMRIIFPATRIQLPSFDVPPNAVSLPIDFIAHNDDGGEETDVIYEIGSGEAL